MRWMWSAVDNATQGLIKRGHAGLAAFVMIVALLVFGATVVAVAAGVPKMALEAAHHHR